MVTIDGAAGEGGGQILRSALALAIATGRALRIEHVRAQRRRPGLRPQHLAAVRAAAAICSAQVEGAELGAQVLVFRPGRAHAGDLELDVGTAGSAVLVAQTVLPALLTAPAPCRVTLGGGTHNPMAPSFEFLAQAYLPALRMLGPGVRARLVRRGFYPRGGGRVHIEVDPVDSLTSASWIERGPITSRRARAVVAGLPRHIAERELDTLSRDLGPAAIDTRIEVDSSAAGPGNYVALVLEAARITEVVTGHGRRGVAAEHVAQAVVDEARRYIDADVPVGSHLADQLVTPLALAGGGSFITLAPSTHTETQLALVERILGVRTRSVALDAVRWRIDIGA